MFSQTTYMLWIPIPLFYAITAVVEKLIPYHHFTFLSKQCFP